jgi:hypothetical protein
VHRKFARYALRRLGSVDTYDFPPYVDQCILIRLETLTLRRFDAFVIFFLDQNLLSPVNVIALSYRTHGGDFLRIDLKVSRQ